MASNGYMVVRVDSGIYHYEHRIVMESSLGRKLLEGEVVHHINHDKTDNRLENLKLLPSQSAHRAEHELTEETKVKISKAMRGRTFTSEHRANLSRAMIGNQNEKNIL